MLHARTLLATTLLLTGCKGDQRDATPASPPAQAFPELAPAPTAMIEPVEAPLAGSGSGAAAASPRPAAGTPRGSAFPTEMPAIVVFRGAGGDTPRTELSLRIWSDGIVRFKCGRRGTLPPDRVKALVAAFVAAGWDTEQSLGPQDSEMDGSCAMTTVQVTRAGTTHRRRSSCGMSPSGIIEAVQLVQSVVGPDPCP